MSRIRYNDEYNEQLLSVLSICRCNYQKYLRSGETKQHKDLRYLYFYILRCTKSLPQDTKFSIRVFWVLNKWRNWPKCEVCGKELILPKTNKGFKLKVKARKLVYNWPRHCCNKCAQLDIKTKQKQIETFRKKYGCNNPFQNEEIKKKCREQHLKNYGVDVPFKSKEIREKYKQTMLEKYGVENSFQLQTSKNAANSEEAKQKRNNSLSSYNMEKFGVPWYVMSSQFKQKTDTEGGTSKEEKELVDFIRSITDCDLEIGSFKIIYPKQLDIYIPQKKLAFEFNGTYFHSYEKTNDLYYHLNKTKQCEELGIHLVHIWEDEWIYDKEKTKDLIRNIIQDVVSFPDKKILKIDRSKFNKAWKIPGYKLIKESKPKLVLRGKQNKYKYLVPDCGKLIYEKENI